MEAHRLDFGDCVPEGIECSHTLEHLGLAEAIHSIAEFFRVLEPDGALLLHTPDIEASFQPSLRSGADKRRYLLNWIYSVDRAGMSHKYGHPAELLEMLLADTGFTDIEVKKRAKGTVQPETAIICRKPKHSEEAQMISRLRRSLVDSGVVDVHDQVAAIDHEDLISDVRLSIMQKRNISVAAVADIAAQSPAFLRVLLGHMHDCG
jgi:hypothetical protein